MCSITYLRSVFLIRHIHTEEPHERECSRCHRSLPCDEEHFCKRYYKGATTLDSHCRECKREVHDAWAAKNQDYLKKKSAQRRMELRLKVLRHYGPDCACCSEARVEFLAIDHTDGGGTQHRLSLGARGRGISFYAWLIKQGLPEGYRVLCHNCNTALGLYGYCPHAQSTRPSSSPSSLTTSAR